MPGELEQRLRSPDWKIRFAAMRDLEQVATASHLPVIVELLRDSESGLRNHAAWLIARLRAYEFAGEVAKLLSDGWWGCRRAACSVLEELEAREYLAMVAPLTQDPNDDVRHAAASALVHLRAEEHLDSLIPLLTETKGYLSAMVAEGLCDFGTTRWVPHVLPLLDSHDPTVRRRCLTVLARVGSRGELAAVERLFEDEDVAVRCEARLAAAILETTKHGPALVTWIREAGTHPTSGDHRELPYLARAMRTAADLAPREIAQLISLLAAHPNEYIAGLAILLMARLGLEHLVPVLRNEATARKTKKGFAAHLALVRLGAGDPVALRKLEAQFRQIQRDSCLVSSEELEFYEEVRHLLAPIKTAPAR